MILKAVERRAGVRDRLQGLLRYLAGPGRFNEHTNPRLIAANVSMSDPTGLNLQDPEVVAELAADMQRPAEIFETPPPAGKGAYVYHVPVTLHLDDGQLTDDQWAYVARKLADKVGLSETEEHAAVRWAAVHHGTTAEGLDHIHFVAYLAREDGEQVKLYRDYQRLGELRQEMEEDPTLGLTVRTKRTGAGRGGASRAESERADRAGRAQPDRDELERLVRAAAAGASCEGEWVRAMRANGLLVAPRYGNGEHSHVVGYSVAVRPSEGTRPVFYGGGKLSKDLTLTAVRHRWDGHDPAHALAAWSRKAARADMAERVAPAARRAQSEHEFVTALRADGMVVLPRYGSDGSSVTGYRVARAPQTNTVDRPTFFTDAEVGQPLTQLREQWPTPNATAAASVWSARAARGHVAQVLRATRGEAVDEADWITAVRQAGLRLLPRYDDTRDRVVGYTAVLPDDDRDVVARDDRLPEDLHLDVLRSGWPATPRNAAEASAAWKQHPLTDDHSSAISAASAAADRMSSATAQLDPRDPDGWALVAREQAELVAAVADQLPSGQARAAAYRAVRSLGHAAELPHGYRRGTASEASHGIRAMSRALSGVRMVGRGGAQGWMHLLLSAARVAEQLQHTRTARAELADARHARDASSHLLHARQIIRPRDVADEINAALAESRPASTARIEPSPGAASGRRASDEISAALNEQRSPGRSPAEGPSARPSAESGGRDRDHDTDVSR